jgi:hypothetical protein
MALDFLNTLTPEQQAVALKVATAAKKYGVPVDLALAAAMQESGFNQKAVSPTGPVGVMQMGKKAAQDMKVDRHNEDQNIDGGMRYLKQQLDKHDNKFDTALIAYHDGPGSDYFKGGKASPEALNHIEKIKSLGGFATPVASTETVPSSENFGVEPVANIEYNDSGDEEDGGRTRSLEDVVAAGTGAAAGAGIDMMGKKYDTAKQQLIDEQQVLAQQRLALAQKNAPPAYGSGTQHWAETEYNEDVNRFIKNPTDKPHAVAMAKQVIPQIQKGVAMAPNAAPYPGSMILNPSPLPPKIPAAPSVGTTMPPLPPTYRPSFGEITKRAIKTTSAPGRIAGGAIAGGQGYDAYERAQEGDIPGAIASGLSAAGGVGMATAPKKYAPLFAVPAIGGGALQYLVDKFGPKKKESVLEEQPVEKFDKGGLAKKAFGVVAAPLSELGVLAPRALRQPTAEEIAAFQARPTQQMKFSEAIAPHQGKYLGLHMSDRFGTHGNRMGGTGFTNFQNISPVHAVNDVVWMNDSENAANKIAQQTHFNGQPMIHSNYIGAPAQHKSNKTVHADILDNFYKRLNAGEIPEETLNKINAGIQVKSRGTGTVKNLNFSEPFDIRDRFAAQEIGGNTMDSRGALSEMLGTGTGVGGTKHIAVPNYYDILASHADPLTQGAPTSSVGTRLFSINNEPTQMTDMFHPDYRYTVHGKDEGVQFPAVPQNIAAQKFVEDYQTRFPGKDPHGNAWFSYPGNPQLIDKNYIARARDLGYAQGGLV